MARDDSAFGKRSIVGNSHHTTRGHGDILGVAAPTINTDAFAVDAKAFIASKACFACFTRRCRDHGDPVPYVERRDCGPDFYDFARRIGAKHMGQSDIYRIFAGANDAVECAVDGNRMDFDPMILPSQRFEETGLLQLVVDRRVYKLFGLVVFRSRIGFGHGCDDIFRGLEG